jgi:hypothetical protein
MFVVGLESVDAFSSLEVKKILRKVILCSMTLALFRDSRKCSKSQLTGKKAQRFVARNMKQSSGHSKKESAMKKEQILAFIKSMSGSQGFYSRLYSDLMAASEQDRNGWLQNMEDEKFGDELDLVMALEG